MFSYLIDTDYPFDQTPYFNNCRRRYYNPHQACAYSYPSYTHPQSFLNFHIPQNRYFPDPYHLRESYYDPENIVNLVSNLNQIHDEEKNNHDKERKRNGYRRVKISGPEDER
ncbi:839_t:CDS:1, partial [Cetraspora pellucida]